MKVMPLGDRILVKMVEMETKTAGGILIPQTAQEKTQEGIVIAVGDDESIKVKAKDRVIYDKYAGTTIKSLRGGAAHPEGCGYPGEGGVVENRAYELFWGGDADRVVFLPFFFVFPAEERCDGALHRLGRRRSPSSSWEGFPGRSARSSC